MNIPDEQGLCPTCGKEVVVVFDSDADDHVWIHEVWRACPCPMAAKLDDYWVAWLPPTTPTGDANASE